MKILIIDDNESITRMMQKYLKLKQHDCIVANQSRNGLQLIRDQKFDVVLLDVSMPELDGIEIVYDLVKTGKIKEQKIILFTASNMSKETIEGLLKQGVHSCIAKPVSMDLLFQTIGA